ncbi:hypothetical protein ACPA2N_25975 [Ectopseudomonas hydrolytica]|uniref:hypothetical protein n=1 Tax=Ectopseudomonas hydrolytica TaxID=2493633 RepID=UPI003C2F0CE4
MSQLKILFPEPVVVGLAGRQVQIKPVQLRDFERFGRAAAIVIAMGSSKTMEELYAYAVVNGQLRDILRTATNLSRWRIWRLPAAAAVSLMIEVIRVNAGFFEKALVEAEKALAGAKSPAA